MMRAIQAIEYVPITLIHTAGELTDWIDQASIIKISDSASRARVLHVILKLLSLRSMRCGHKLGL